MDFGLLIWVIVIIALFVSSYTDIRTREVPDWVSYGLILISAGIRLTYFFATFDWSYLTEGALGFVLFAAIALIMFYAGQWGGGDAKIMMGIGALLGLRLDWMDFSLGFIVNIFLLGAVYGLVWSSSLALLNWKRFKKEVKAVVHAKKMILARKLSLLVSAVLLVIALFAGNFFAKLMLFTCVLLFMSTFYLWIFIRAVEKACMYILLEPERLTEGDWIAKDVVVAGKKICGPKDLGVSMSQIRKLIRLKKQRKINKVLIKQGIPFIPSFLLAFIATWLFGNLFLVFVR